MIKHFKCKETKRILDGYFSLEFPHDIQRVAKRKLTQLDAAATLAFLRVPPGNRLESLEGDRKGQHSIRINDKWRICFVFQDGNVFNVEIVDYH
jgi:proteic killer suppression protein